MSDALRAAYALAPETPLGGPQAAGPGTADLAQRRVPSAVPAAPRSAAGAQVDAALQRELAEERAAIMAGAGDVPTTEIVAYCLSAFGVMVQLSNRHQGTA